MDRLSVLLRERSSLLEEIGETTDALEREKAGIQSRLEAVATKMGALIAEHGELCRELHRSFEELLVEGRLSRTAARKARAVYRDLQESGLLDPVELEPNQEAAFPAGDEGSEEADMGSWEAAPSNGDSAPPSPRAGGFSAPHSGGQAGNETLRELFRRLVTALHPDRVRHEGEQRQRTEVMKEVTRAYEEGDFARLVQIEAAWLRGEKAHFSAESEDARCARLERVVEELRRQLATLTREIDEVRRTSPLRALADEMRRLGMIGGRRRDPIDALFGAAEKDVARLREVRDFVRSFCERKISLAAFLEGPPPRGLLAELDLSDAIAAMLGQASADQRGSRQRRRARGRKIRIGDLDDIPF
jgi:hypothetical protein